MQQPNEIKRWWYSDDKKSPSVAPRSPSRANKKSPSSNDQKRCFQVTISRNLMKEEKLAITGDCEALGNWEPQDVVIMNRNEGKETKNYY